MNEHRDAMLTPTRFLAGLQNEGLATYPSGLLLRIGDALIEHRQFLVLEQRQIVDHLRGTRLRIRSRDGYRPVASTAARHDETRSNQEGSERQESAPHTGTVTPS